MTIPLPRHYDLFLHRDHKQETEHYRCKRDSDRNSFEQARYSGLLFPIGFPPIRGGDERRFVCRAMVVAEEGLMQVFPALGWVPFEHGFLQVAALPSRQRCNALITNPIYIGEPILGSLVQIPEAPLRATKKGQDEASLESASCPRKRGCLCLISYISPALARSEFL